MLLRELKAEKKEVRPGYFQYEPSLSLVDYNPGIHTVKVHFQKEELEVLQQRGIDVRNIPTSFPCSYAFTIPYGSETPTEDEDIKGLQHAFKERDPKHVMSRDDLERVMRNGIDRIMRLKARKMSKIQNAGKEDHVFVLPLGSSSQSTINMFAEIVAQKTKAQMIPDAFYKSRNVQHSSHVKTKDDTFVPRQNRRKINPDNWKIKNMGHGQPDFRRGFYNFQNMADPGLLQTLNGAMIILVDDNINSGTTMGDAYKELFRQGIQPASVVGVALHLYV
jgi:hypothetical protein